MTDTMHQPKDENGRYVSIVTLFEREREDHQKDHAEERVVAKETAQRLEREVENTAVRIEAAVVTALAAVGEKALVHASSHDKEHMAHERIHSVEKTQVDKALDESEKTARLHQTSHQEQHTAHENVHAAHDNAHTIEHERLIQIEKKLAYYAGAAAVAGAAIALIIRLVTA